MRVVTGRYKGRRFDIPRTFRGHPTTDFAKENLFNVLKGYIDIEDATCLDLFAGTGSISLELLSRGAQRVVSVELEPTHVAFIRQCIERLGETHSTLVCMDAFRYLKRCEETFNFIFADPPYNLDALPTLPDLIMTRKLLREDGIFVLEHGKNHSFSTHQHFVQQRVYGKVNFSIFSLR